MDLLDVAEVNPDSERWTNYLGLNRVARECGVWVLRTDPCEDTSGDVIGDDTSRAGQYTTRPFFYEARLTRSVACELPDDAPWTMRALKEQNDRVAGNALVVQAIADTDSYTGHADVASVTWTTTTDVTKGDSVTAGRKLWTDTIAGAGVHPIMHVPPSIAPALARAGILLAGQDKNIWGDVVVINSGYDSTNPRVFWTGPIKIYLSTVEDPGLMRIPRTNDSLVSVNQMVMVDVAPCTIVRVGPYS
jgi:hypothetical protein